MRRYILMVAFGVLLLVAAAVALAPLWLERRLEDQLAGLTRLPVRVESVRLNVLDGSVTVNQLEIGDDLVMAGRIEVDVAYLPLFDHSVVLQSAELADARIRLRWRGDALELPPLDLPAASETGSDAAPQWRFLLQSGRVANTQLVLEEPDITQRLQIDTLAISGLTPQGREPIPLKLQGSINDSPIRFEGSVILAAGERSVAGTLDLEPLSLAALHNHLPVAMSGEIGIRGMHVEARLESALQLALTGRLDMRQPGVEIARLQAGSEQLNWSGSVTVRMPEAGAAEVNVTGDLAVTGLHAGAAEPILGATAVVLSGIDVKLDPATGRKVSIDSLRAGDLELHVTRGEDGTLVVPAARDAAADTGTEGADSTGTPGNERAPVIEIGSIEITGKSQIAFNDRSVSPPIALALTDLHLSGTGLGTETPFAFRLEARQGEAAELSGSGTLTALLSSEPVGSATVDLRAFDLNQVAPYLAVAQIRSGRADLHTKLEMDAAEVRLANNVQIDHLRLDRSDEGGDGSGLPISVALDLLKDKNDHIDLDVPIVSKRDNLEMDPSDVFQVALRNATRKAALAYTAVALQPFGSILLIKNLAGKANRPQLEAVNFPPGRVLLPDAAADYVAKIGHLLGDRPELKLTLCGVATASDKEQLVGDLLAEQLEKKAAAGPGATPDAADETRQTTLPPPEVSPEQLKALAESRRQTVLKALNRQGIDTSRLLGCNPQIAQDQSKPRVELLL